MLRYVGGIGKRLSLGISRSSKYVTADKNRFKVLLSHSGIKVI